MVEFLIFCDKSQINEATSVYIGRISSAIEKIGYKVKYVDRLHQVPNGSLVLVVETKSAFKLRLFRPKAQVWLWMQGITPEEARLHMGSRAREILWNIFERVALPKISGAFLVSQAMKAHLVSKYRHFKAPTFVMPCVNASLTPSLFFVPGKFRRPTFVYAGSMHSWQCIALTIEAFYLIKQRIPEAELTIFTTEIEKAKQLVRDFNLTDIEISHVPLKQLPKRLSNFKYGFVLRDTHVVNKVATPTKVSTYMASGVIPIMTMAIEDYNIALSSITNKVQLSNPEPEKIAEAIFAMEQKEIEPAEVLQDFTKVFENYFDGSNYQDGIAQFLLESGVNPI